MTQTIRLYDIYRADLFSRAKARQEYREGKTISLKTREEMQRYFDSL